MQPMKNVMNSVARCLAIVSLFITNVCFGQEYIEGKGELIKYAIEDLKVKAMEYAGVQVSTHRKSVNRNGEYDYHEVTAADFCVEVPLKEVTLRHEDGVWYARIEVSKLRPIESKWVEQNITVNNTTNAQPYYSRGYKVNESTTRTTRERRVVGPSGRTVQRSPGKTTTARTRSRWNGRYRSTRTKTY